MNHRIIKPFAWIGIFVMVVSLACTLGSSPTPKPSSTPVAVQEEPTQKPEASKPPEATKVVNAGKSGAIDNREDVEKAVVRIVSQGSFVDPQIGSYEGIGSGSGFVIDPSGIAVTNNHVVTGAALIKVYFSGDDTPHNAMILGVSECSDLALIKIEGGPFPYLKWSANPIKVGTDVWSAGYPLGDPEYSFHRGVISKAHATPKTSWAAVADVVEHDATINPGNSGGPLVDNDGQVIGVNYASSNQAANQYYAIAKAGAEPVLSVLVMGKNDTFIGVNGTAVASDDGSISGIWVSSVASGSPADKAGLQGGDIILSMEGVTLGRDATMSDYCDILRTHKVTDTLSIKVLRYSAGQLLDGQLNGRTLSVAGTFDTGSSNSGNGSSGNSSSGSGTPQDVVDNFSKDAGNFEIFDGSEVSDGVLYLGQFSDCADVGSDEPFGCFTQCLTCGLASTYDMQVDSAYVSGVTERTFGMVLRFVDNNNNGLVDKDDYYLDFELSIYDQYFIIWEHRTDGKWYIIDQKVDGNILPGSHVNTLRAVASNGGSDIDIYLNDNFVDGITKIPYDNGTVGLVVGGRAMQAAFDNFNFTVQ